MPSRVHPRVLLSVALILTIVGVIGESLAGSTIMHLASVVLVVGGLIAVVLVVPGLAAQDETDPSGERVDPPVAHRPPRV